MDRPFYIKKIFELLPQLLPYLFVTFGVVTGTILAGAVIGFILARGRLSKRKWANWLSGFVINSFRCTPSIVMLFVVFYGFPALVWAVFKVDINGWSKVFFVILSLSLLFSATAAEIMRSSYLAVSAGQTEAALTSGLTEKQAFIRIVLPQAFAVSIPNLGNSVIILLKEGSLAYTIGLIDVMGKGNLIISNNFGAYALETYIALTIIYWSLTIVLEQAFKKWEKAVSRGRRSI